MTFRKRKYILYIIIYVLYTTHTYIHWVHVAYLQWVLVAMLTHIILYRHNHYYALSNGKTYVFEILNDGILIINYIEYMNVRMFDLHNVIIY